MKKSFTIFLVLVIFIGGAYILFNLLRTNNPVTLTREQAISLVKEKNSELNSYPSDNLPPKRIEAKTTEGGWLLGFYILGSGRPGILSAKCYKVSNGGEATATGKFIAEGIEGPVSLDLASCQDAF